MLRRLIAAVAAFALIATSTPAFAEDLGPTLDAAMKDTKIPAMGMLIMRDGKITGQAQRGVRRNDGSDPVRPGDVWHIGSDGKAMTATMVARLVERGLLRWDEPLDEMLPQLAAAGRADYRKVTLIQLLTHQSGLPHDVVDEKQLTPFFTDKRPLTAQRLAYLALVLKDPPVNTPGTTFSYSNSGFLLAAAAAERATGKPYETLMRSEVFEPLGLRSPGFGVTHAGQPIGHLDGKPATPLDENPDFFAPAGNIYLTLDDWGRFCLDQMAGSGGHGRLLKTETYRLMQTAHAGGDVGLGWGVAPSFSGRQGPALVHAGSDGTWYAIVVLFPADGSGVLVAANAGQDVAGAAEKVAIKAVLPTLAPAAPAQPAPAPAAKP
jgi:CubicO group peptidase (beta-lactamase class C family)